MSIEQKDIFRIKKHGHLIALSNGWQYWLYNGIIYSINTAGDHVNVWCDVPGLPAHLIRLYQITGKRFFTEQTQVIDKSFIKKFIYA
jgi:hypothetical protein